MAVSINVVDYDNNAIVGDSGVTADIMTVEAGMIPETTASPSAVSIPDKSKGWLMDLLENALKDLILDIAKSAGLADLFGESSASVLADQLTKAVKAAKDELLKGTGFENFLNTNPVEQLQKNVQAFLSLFLDFPNRMNAELNKLFPGEGKDALTRIKEASLKYLKTEAWPVIMNAILVNVTAIVNPVLQGFLNPTGSGGDTDEQSRVGAVLKKAFLDEPNGILIAARDKIEKDILDLISKELGTRLTVDKKATVQENLKENMRLALKAVFDKVGNTLTDGICNITEFKNFLKGPIKDTLLKNLKDAASAMGRALTNAALDEITGILGAKVEVDKAYGHKFTTQAIAGASGQKVAIAGAVAIAVIHGDTGAVIKGADTASANYVTVTKDLTIKAEGDHVEKTTASAAEDSKGEADANLNAGASQQTAGTGTEASVDKSISTD